MDSEIAKFVAERDAALKVLDLGPINAVARKYGGVELPDTEVGWAAFHKARTAVSALPKEMRAASRQWLKDRGYSHFGDE